MSADAARVAIVTGGGQGIGRAVVRRLARDGFHVLAIDRQEEAVRGVAEDLAGEGLSAEAVPADVTDRAAIAGALAAHPSVAACVCAAGVSWLKSIDEVTEDDFRRILDVNLIGSFIVAQEALKRMGAGGRIVFIASRAAVGGVGFPHYVASKAAVIGLTRAMALELRERQIAVNAVSPGFTDTPMTRSMPAEDFAKWSALEPGGKPAAPDQIAQAVAFFTDARTDFVTGQVLYADGGKSLGGTLI